VWNKCILQQSK